MDETRSPLYHANNPTSDFYSSIANLPKGWLTHWTSACWWETATFNSKLLHISVLDLLSNREELLLPVRTEVLPNNSSLTNNYALFYHIDLLTSTTFKVPYTRDFHKTNRNRFLNGGQVLIIRNLLFWYGLQRRVEGFQVLDPDIRYFCCECNLNPLKFQENRILPIILSFSSPFWVGWTVSPQDNLHKWYGLHSMANTKWLYV